ncbi:DUF1398 domain-containing protein [Flavobacterium gawalongense]|uniref:DUF1398 domain-containing protein n=1 Tax=Flavobacterium gawalongense TaxID=2594432 RepID=A0A553BI69_9FLAO|nr:DUF1398 family protein [Flavobacterium gawalongense]TRX07935.1 DUF1398 domain-containing protein [Flavobacterium gawalongense]TRX08636.1 DUF1398 domain-containing protein [Flavobacterium gawalongense]TRX24584.1 DUF1398 domain-containing protein [Flavobacterium gawalongense]
MFTTAQIKEAHSKVKSGADFPAYIQDLIELGVKGYDTFVNDGHVEYFGEDNFRAAATDTYSSITVAASANKERFIEFLVMHQDGQTDYLTFCNHAAQCGIARWSVNIIEMTCTYFDKLGSAILIEKIPA